MNDRHIQEQMLQLSMAPPPGIWAQVALCLEQDALWQEAGTWETPPPAAAWDNIAAELSGVPLHISHWQQVQQAAVPAPESVWQQVQLVLQQEDWVAPIRNEAIPPPAGSWDAIRNALPGTKARVVPLRRVVQIAAAAVVTGILLFAGYRYLYVPPQNPPAVVTDPKPTHPSATLPQTAETADVPVAAEVFHPQEVTEVTTGRNEKYRYGSAPSVQDAKSKKALLHRAVVSTATTAAFDETRYMLVLDASGELVRVSPKLGQLPCAPNEAGVPDAVAALDSPACKEWLKTLQERLALSAPVPPFAGGIELYEVLKVTE
ncbi:MAG: hypothetical protein ACK4E8_03510 [Lacibacter sp.]